MINRSLCILVLFSCTACSSWMGIKETFFPSSDTPAAHTAPTSTATDAQTDACRAEAEKRLPLYVHSDIYPLSDQEKKDALTTLMSGCMKQYDTGTTAANPAPAPVPQATPAPVAASPFGAPTSVTSAAAADATGTVPFAHAAPTPPAPPVTAHTATAAPVTAVSVTSTTPPPLTTPTTSAPFNVAVPPSPELAAKIAHVTPAAVSPPPPPTPHLEPGSAGAQQLENIVGQP